MGRNEPVGRGTIKVKGVAPIGKQGGRSAVEKQIQLHLYIDNVDGGFRKATLIYQIDGTGIAELDGKRFWLQTNHFTTEDAVRGWMGRPPYTHLKSDIQNIISAIIDTIGRFLGSKSLEFTWDVTWVKTEWEGNEARGWLYRLDRETLWIEQSHQGTMLNAHGVYGRTA